MMNIDKIAPMVAVAISLIAVFVPFEYWGLLLIVIGLAHGLMSPVDDLLRGSDDLCWCRSGCAVDGRFFW